MSTVELRKWLIDKIQQTDNKSLLQEALRLFENEAGDIEIYKLSEEQKNIVNEAKQEINNGQFLTNEHADKEIDEWLKE